MPPLKDASTLHYGTAGAIGVVMSLAIFSATAAGNSDINEYTAFSEQLAGRTSQALHTIDLNMSAMAQALAASATATGGTIPRESFDVLAQRFFALTRETQGIAFFRSFPDQNAALQFTQPNADGIARFTSDNTTLFLGATQVMQDPRIDGSRMAFSGSNGKLPLVLVSGPDATARMGQALNFDLPVSSNMFEARPDGIVPVEAANMYSPGTSGFWRMISVRGYDQNKRPASLGILAAFVDAPSVFRAQNGSALNVTGPLETTSLPEPGGYVDNGTKRQTVVSSGVQGFKLGFTATTESRSFLSWIFSLFGGLIAAGATYYAIQNESNGRYAAERKLALHRREFKKRTVELKRSEDRFRRLAESTNVIPWAADMTKGRFTYIGPQIERLCGYPAKSWCASGFWADHVHPEDRRKVADSIGPLESGGYATVEYKVRSADGRLVHMRNMLTVLDSRRKDGSTVRIAQGYMLDITEMKTAQKTMDQARKGAEEANKSKSEFLANMSHELRTPLNSVIGFAEVMKDEIFGPIGDRYKEYAESVHSSGQHLLSLINDVLDLSKIEAGKIELVEEETDIAVILSKCRQLLHERASQAGLSIQLVIPEPLPFVFVDGRRIKQVILNLMSNAVKFTPPGGRITLRAELQPPQGLMISVSDNGIGMTKEEVAVALEQFGQIDSELSRQHEGTGLGLPIARSLAELHGGKLDVESQKDSGTAVTIWLPIERVVPKGNQGNVA